MDHQSPRSMQMKTFITTVALGACLLFPSGGLVFAGQPGASCEGPPVLPPPGNAGSPSNTGSPFSPNGIAGTRYADSPENRPSAHSSPNATSQYDVACLRQSQNHPTTQQ